jgi:phosphatidylglycerol lysyltransferase
MRALPSALLKTWPPLALLLVLPLAALALTAIEPAGAVIPLLLHHRGLALAVVLPTGLLGVLRLVRWPIDPPMLPTTAQLAQARGIMLQTNAMRGHLALAGDKRLLFSPSGGAFIMYGIVGRSWIAMGDPVGDGAEAVPLVPAFLALCARHQARPAFYRVGAEFLPLYASLGFSALKVGEEAHVSLSGPAGVIAGPGRSNLRQSMRRAAREGCTFEVLEPGHLPAVLETLQAVSRLWLDQRPTREKRFSCGWFDAAYLGHSHVALVRCNGAPVAFANFWPPEAGGELVADLMRRDPAAPYGAMDFLFARLMQWGAERGYQTLNLGMAPLSGFDRGALAPAWRIIGTCAARLAARFYNFAGLRRFKLKFAPEWQPKYLVSRGGMVQPIIILDVAKLAAGGLRGLIAK